MGRDAIYQNIDTATSRYGFADIRLGFSFNFIGSPALDLSEFKTFKQFVFTCGDKQDLKDKIIKPRKINNISIFKNDNSNKLDILTNQNYVFKGLPYNGDFTLHILPSHGLSVLIHESELRNVML